MPLELKSLFGVWNGVRNCPNEATRKIRSSLFLFFTNCKHSQQFLSKSNFKEVHQLILKRRELPILKQKFVSLNGPLSRLRKLFWLLSFEGVKMGGKTERIKRGKQKTKIRIGFSWDGVVLNEQDSKQ